MCSRKDIPKGPLFKKIKKSSDLQKQQLSVLCSLPGIGEKFAVRMLEKFGTPFQSLLLQQLLNWQKLKGWVKHEQRKLKKSLESKSKFHQKVKPKNPT